MSCLQIPDKEYEGYIFDHDGTLALSMDVHFEAWTEAYKRNNAKFTLTRELNQSLAGTGMKETVERLNEMFGDSLDPAKVLEAQEAHVWENMHRIKPNLPVVNFARKMAPTHPLAVASGGINATVNKILHTLGIDRLFPVVVTQEDVVNGKPAPDMFLLAAEKLGVDPRRCLVFEDGELGIKAAEAAGMDWVYVDPEKCSAETDLLLEEMEKERREARRRHSGG